MFGNFSIEYILQGIVMLSGVDGSGAVIKNVFIVATGKTVLEGGDVLLVLGDQGSLKANSEILGRPKS